MLDETRPDALAEARLILPPEVSISAVVVIYHTGPTLRECLYALRSDPQIDEIVIVNNGMPKPQRGWISRFVEGSKTPITVIDTAANLGFAKGVNRGVQRATGNRILVINPDAVLKRGGIAALESAREGRKSPCLVGGKLFYPNGLEQRGARRELLTLPRAFATYFGLTRFYRTFGLPVLRPMHLEHLPAPKGPVPMQVVSGALMYCSVEDFWSVDGFDEGYFLHVEDIDLCRRVAEAGGEVIYTPLASALHYGSTSKVSRAFVEWNKAKGLARYFNKHTKNPLEQLAVWIFVPVMAGLLMGRAYAINTGNRLRNLLRKVRPKRRTP